MSPPVVHLDRVSVTFGTQAVLRDVSLTVPANQALLVVGESGCGKTVLLKLIVGLLRPNQGSVRLYDRDLATLSTGELAAVRRRVGFLFQGAALFDSMNVFDNVAYPLRALAKAAPTDIEGRVRDRLTEVGLPESAAKKMPSELSGGMRKRVGLARALALDPDLMLYDEPTTGLDPVMTGLINDLIAQTRERRPVTSIVVTHDMSTVRAVADRVVMLYPLARLIDGESQSIYDGPASGMADAADERIRRFVAGDSRPGLTND